MADLRFEPPQKHPGWQVRNFRKLAILQETMFSQVFSPIYLHLIIDIILLNLLLYGAGTYT